LKREEDKDEGEEGGKREEGENGMYQIFLTFFWRLSEPSITVTAAFEEPYRRV